MLLFVVNIIFFKLAAKVEVFLHNKTQILFKNKILFSCLKIPVIGLAVHKNKQRICGGVGSRRVGEQI